MKINLQLFAYYVMENGKLVQKSSIPSTKKTQVTTPVLPNQAVMDSAGSVIKDVRDTSASKAMSNLGLNVGMSAGQQFLASNNPVQNAIASVTPKPSDPRYEVFEEKLADIRSNSNPSAPVATEQKNTVQSVGSRNDVGTSYNTGASQQVTLPDADKYAYNGEATTVNKPDASNYAYVAPTMPDRSGQLGGVDADTLNRLQGLANQNNIVSQGVLDQMNKPFNVSQAYLDAMAYTNQLLEQLSTGKTSYTERLDSLLGQIQNRDKFSYDMNSDPMFQQALASAMRSGKTAMQDTMGQASMLTGGYGSSYATSAASQAYNAYIQDAYDNLPEYYNMALEAYNLEGQDMYNQLAALSDADMKEYERNYNAFNANMANAQQMYNNEYTQWADSIQQALNNANLQLNENNQMFNQLFNYTNMMNDEYWKDANFNESIRQYENNFAEGQRQFDTEMAYKDASFNEAIRQYEKNFLENQRQYDTDTAYKNALMANNNAQWEKEYALSQQKADSASNVTYKEPSEPQKKKALDAFNEFGEEGLYQYVDSLPSDINIDIIYDYIKQYGKKTTNIEKISAKFKEDYPNIKITTGW